MLGVEDDRMMTANSNAWSGGFEWNAHQDSNPHQEEC